MNFTKLTFFIAFLLIGQASLYAQNWQLVWQDEFTNGISGDWVFETGTGGNGWGNNELEYYRQENASVQNGKLVMTAKREGFGGMNYTSVRMKTQGRKSWKYGKIEASIAVPSFQGAWPAFWMLGDNIGSVGWPACGEIDIMEHINTGNTDYGTIHWDNGGHQQFSNSTNVNTITNYHTYAVEWNDQSIKWFVDGGLYATANISNNINGTEEFHKNFFILLNFAIGGNWPGYSVDNNAFPSSMMVDYVRVYQDNGVVTVPSTTDVITAYKDCNYGGYSGGLAVGDYTTSKLNALGVLNNDISSLKVAEGFKAILFDGDNFTGASTVVTSDNSCLGGWNDIVSSVQIRTNGVTTLAGTYFLQNRNSNLYMDVTGGTGATGDGANIQQWNTAGTTNQQFQFTHLGDGTYKVLAMHSMKSVDVAAINKANGANVQQWTYYGTPNQQFVMVSTGDGYYKMIPKHSGKLVEVAGANTAPEANVQQWSNNNQTCGMWKLVPIQAVVGNGDGLTANYFNGMNFETPVYSRKDATINFDWGNGSPNASVNSDQFSTRWTGQIQPKYSGAYTFYINSDNGRRLWINNQLIIDKWIDDWNIEYTGTITLTAGQKYDIKIEYFENNGGANCKMEWSSSLQNREVVPQSQLYSNPLPGVSITSPSNNASFNAPASITINATASDNVTVSKVDFYNGTSFLGSDNTSPFSFTWNNVGAGTHTITARATDNRGAVSISSAVTLTVNSIVITESPYGGTRWAIPGKIEAENYDLGGQGLAYNDADAVNNGSQYRTSEGVDIEVSTDAGAGYNVGWTAAGEWMKYMVNVNAAGSYNLSVRVAATATGKSFHVEMNGTNISGSIPVPNTGGWQTWQTVTINNISLTAGQKVMRVYMDTDGINLNYVSFVSSSVVVTNQPPTINITSPASNASFNAPASITFTTNASDADGTISKVEFFNGSTPIGTVTSSPFNFTWNNVPAGTFTITAKATDNSIASTTSSPIVVTVKTVTTNTCSGVPQYSENNGYVAGSKVQNAGSIYQCKPYPYSGWCNGASWAYAPGTGSYWSDAWTLLGTCTAAATVPSANMQASVFGPNPATDIINFNLDESSKVTILNSMGTVVMSQDVPANGSLNIAALPAGIYNLKIETVSEIINQTLLKQ